MCKNGAPGFFCFSVASRDSDDTPRAVEKSEAEDREEGKCRFHQENEREVEGGGLIGNFAEKKVGVAACDAREDHEDAEKIVCEGFQNRNFAHTDDGRFGKSSHDAIIRENRAGDFLCYFCRHIPNIGDIERPDGDETDADRCGEFPDIREECSKSPLFRYFFRNGIGAGFRERVEDDEESEEGEENDGGKLGEIGESQEKSGEKYIFP